MMCVCHGIYTKCMYVHVAVLSCVVSSTVTCLSSTPLTITAHTVRVPPPSPTVYNVLSRLMVTPEGREGEAREETGREHEGKWRKKYYENNEYFSKTRYHGSKMILPTVWRARSWL